MWLADHGHARGAVLDLERTWALAREWYRGRMEPEWRGRTIDEARSVLEEVGLTGEFWALE